LLKCHCATKFVIFVSFWKGAAWVCIFLMGGDIYLEIYFKPTFTNRPRVFTIEEFFLIL
jgi:hypothetical protein